jgi:cytochrome c biogenesis protein CcmG/thiol:disulfide interchange protein DsbE
VSGAEDKQGRPWSRQVVGPFTLRHLAVLSVLLVVAALLLVVLTTPLATPPGPLPVTPGSGFYQVDEPTEGLALGQRAPELEGDVDGVSVGLHDLTGTPVTLAERRGHPVWLSFFASWCPPCQEEVPVLREAYRRYAPSGLEMIAVSVQETTVDDVAAYADRYDLPYPIGFDATSAVFHTYQGFGIPTHVFIDADGIIRHLQYGPMDLARVAEVVEPLLEASATTSVGPTAPIVGAAVTASPASSG